MDWIKRRCTSLFIVLLMYSSLSLAAYENNSSRAADWLSGRQTVDGSWGNTASEKFLFTVEAVQALRAVGQRNAAYFKGISWLENHAVNNADFSARRALALGAHGDNVSADLIQLAGAQNIGIAGRDAWGLNSLYLQAPLDTALVLKSLSALGASVNVQAAINYLKAAQLSGTDQGWSLALESASDPYATAMVLRTLAALKTQDSTLATPVNNGFTTLGRAINASSPDSLIALAAHAAVLAGNTAAQTWLNLLVGKQSTPGSWSAKVYDTALAMRALAAADGMDSPANQAAVLIPDRNLRVAINAALSRNAMDSLDRSELSRLTALTAVGQGISNLTGLEWAINLQSADLRSNNITSTVPIDGLTQLTSLMLEGNPVLLASNLDNDIPTLPEWGVILMAALLLLGAVKHQRTNPYQSMHRA